MAEEKRKGCLVTFFAIIGVLALIIIGIIVFVQCNGGNVIDPGTGKITYRNATLSDIDGDWNNGLLDQSYVFIPKHDITNLEFTFSINNNENEVIKTIRKTVGDVKKGQQYTVTLSVSDLGDLDTMWNAKKTYLTVSGGRVALL